MKRITLFLLLLLTPNISSQNLSRVDKIIKSYPSVNSFEELSTKIDSTFNTDLEKVKAIYTWLALNVKYHKENRVLLEAPEFIVYTDKEDLERKQKRRNEKIALKTFETRKAVCEGYALSFQKLCNSLNIENELIKGYVKTNPNEIDYLAKNKNHIWNAVKIKNEWVLLDITFGSGYSINGKWKTKLDNYYFNIKKEKLNLTHYPSEQKWLSFMKQIPLRKFCSTPIFSKVFLNSNVKLISPKKGRITTLKRKVIKLKLNEIKYSTEVLYSYDKDKIAKKAEINYFDNYAEIIVKGPYKNSDLNIYFNKELALQYKVVVMR